MMPPQMSDFNAKMHKIRFPLRLRPDSAGGAYSALLDPLAVFKGPTFKGMGKREGREMRGGASLQIFWPRTAPACSLFFCVAAVGLLMTRVVVLVLVLVLE